MQVVIGVFVQVRLGRNAMEISSMGKVVVSAKIDNLSDLMRSEAGDIDTDQVRSLEVDDALVDTGATMFSLPSDRIKQLGLTQRRTRTGRTTAGTVTFGIYGPVRLTIDDRDCLVEVCEVPNDCPPLIGQIPLEALDFVIDPVGQKLMGNPDHDGEHMIDLF